MTCRFCRGALGLFSDAADSGMRFSPSEVAALAVKAEKESEELTEVLSSRGYVHFPDGHWGWLDPNQIQ